MPGELFIEPDAGVEDNIDQIHDEVEQDEQRAINGHRPLQQEAVFVYDAVYEMLSGAGDGEDAFHHHAAREKICREGPQKAHHWKDRHF